MHHVHQSVHLICSQLKLTDHYHAGLPGADDKQQRRGKHAAGARMREKEQRGNEQNAAAIGDFGIELEANARMHA
jgi:hypothetical protein